MQDGREEERYHIARLLPQRCLISISALWRRSILRRDLAGLPKDLLPPSCSCCPHGETLTAFSQPRELRAWDKQVPLWLQAGRAAQAAPPLRQCPLAAIPRSAARPPRGHPEPAGA